MAGLTTAQLTASRDSVLAAITAIESGAQSYTTGDGRVYTRASLSSLQARLDWLEDRLARKSGAGSARAQIRPTGTF